jgi:hypothetical protein
MQANLVRAQDGAMHRPWALRPWLAGWRGLALVGMFLVAAGLYAGWG